MSESEGEQTARSVALEQAYVHEVYEQCAEKTPQSKHWPRIYQFLEELEPGALVCDIGCGNGKYLSVNHSVFKVGVDRCKRFTDIAREKENEVLICDNLALPFRDESFDAVLSIAVVHHFATTERRVHALRELARVLRIGGRLVISVWAMEQRHRKFESQDVLVPWPKAYCANVSSDGPVRQPSGQSTANDRQRAADSDIPKHASFCKRSGDSGCRKHKDKSSWIEPIVSSSPSTSSLSSPNETCYSFFRRALQKLARSRRGSGSGRAWFLDGWQMGGVRNRANERGYEQNECTDVDELPIELRRVEDLKLAANKQDTLGTKSKSLGDILEFEKIDLVRSRSSIPGLCSTLTLEVDLEDSGSACSRSIVGSKPRLTKQKSTLDELSLENPDDTAIRETIKDLPDFQIAARRRLRGCVPKQSSMNEELMFTERLEEKERLKRHIMKQASLNEEIICKRRTFETFRDSAYVGNASRKFHLLKSGLTDKIRRSTTNIEKVSGMSIKNGFVRILQGWKSSEEEPPPETSTTDESTKETKTSATNDEKPRQAGIVPQREGARNSIGNGSGGTGERRSSREDGSDSSKDSSLQSDTSVDSEDSFASVIFIPKAENSSGNVDASSASGFQTNGSSSSGSPHPSNNASGLQLNNTSAPPSPRVKHPPDLLESRTKLMSLMKHVPTSKSLPPTSPPAPPSFSPRARSANAASTRPVFFSSASITVPQGIKAPPAIDGTSGEHQSCQVDSRLSASEEAKPKDRSKSLDIETTEPPSDSQETDEFRLTEVTGLPTRGKKAPTLQRASLYRSISQTVDFDEPMTIQELETKRKFSLRSIDRFGGVIENREARISATLIEKNSGEERSVASWTRNKSIGEDVGNDDERRDFLRNFRSTSSQRSIGLQKFSASYPLPLEVPEFPSGAGDGESFEEYQHPRLDFRRTSNARISDVREDSKNSSVRGMDSTLKASKIICGLEVGEFPGVANIAAGIDDTTPLISQHERFEMITESKIAGITGEDDSRRARLNQIKELLKQKPGFATRTKASFPLVRRASTATNRLETVTRVFPRLLSLELFNPETDDLDSDSSGVSSPESVGSVISVISDERYISKKENEKSTEAESGEAKDKAEGEGVASDGAGSPEAEQLEEDPPTDLSRVEQSNETDEGNEDENKPREKEPETSALSSNNNLSTSSFSPQSLKLLEAAAVVANSLERTVDAVIQMKPDSVLLEPVKDIVEKPIDHPVEEKNEDQKISAVDGVDNHSLSVESTWNEDCRQHLIDFTEKLSENLLNRIEQYQRSVDYDSPPEKGSTNESADLGNESRSTEIESQEVEPFLLEEGGCREMSYDRDDAGDARTYSFNKNDEDIIDFVVISSSGEFINEKSLDESEGSMDRDDEEGSSSAGQRHKIQGCTSSLELSSELRSKHGSEYLRLSGAVSTSTISESVSSQDSTKFCSDSTASLISKSEPKSAASTISLLSRTDSSATKPSKPIRSNTMNLTTAKPEKQARSRPKVGSRSASEEISSEFQELSVPNEKGISDSSSQESLSSEHGGGAITYHQYYHVFKEGELDHLIDKYVENLHIISSYYDHASWCIVAEKVQVWTI